MGKTRRQKKVGVGWNPNIDRRKNRPWKQRRGGRKKYKQGSEIITSRGQFKERKTQVGRRT